eukprot:CAMPEP_0194065984 /NCGR_PEP_ID=MMETSP0009_2-20130614/85771_1 /TAXON_ID=210454 /ORGANISM="Grammatophora oceanica, Strain CCMP 410" /LENGTH=73 /DNA_ID=CAMNT_0038718893 /DNA_START=340 /DNA_END=558 /DNA_ORIENTATION=-
MSAPLLTLSARDGCLVRTDLSSPTAVAPIATPMSAPDASSRSILLDKGGVLCLVRWYAGLSMTLSSSLERELW